MAQLTHDCSAFRGPLTSLAEALRLLDEQVSCVVGREVVDLRCARDRVLAEDLVAACDVPPHDNSAVDGFAVAFDDLDANEPTQLPIAGRAIAGHPLGRAVRRGEAVRIFTGAPMPAGCDTVMMQEDCVGDGEYVAIRPGIKRGANRRRAGEDVRRGATILTRGQRLRAQDIGLAAAVGRNRLKIYRPLRVAIFSTGDELREPGEELPPGSISDSNRYTLIALLEGLGCAVGDVGILRDRYDDIRAALMRAAADHDLIVTSGGMSVGDEDHVKAAVSALGSLHFWQLAIKPGRPLGFGHAAGKPFVGLPGNPVAMTVTFLRVVRPLILRLSGCIERAPIPYRVQADFTYRKKTGRREWVRVRLVQKDSGSLCAHKFPRDGAGILSSLVEADGLVELPEDVTAVEAGMTVDFLPFSELR